MHCYFAPQFAVTQSSDRDAERRSFLLRRCRFGGGFSAHRRFSDRARSERSTLAGRDRDRLLRPNVAPRVGGMFPHLEAAKTRKVTCSPFVSASVMSSKIAYYRLIGFGARHTQFLGNAFNEHSLVRRYISSCSKIPTTWMEWL